jgi:large subunit ribosomal protein L10
MSKEKKSQIIDSLEETFSRCTIGILTDYRGLTTSEITALRRRLQESGGEYKVVKNTLARLALVRIGSDNPVSGIEGPIAIALGYSDMTTPAKTLLGYIRESKINLTIKGGFSGNRLLTPEEVTFLSTLPSREIMLARVLGQMKSPVSGLVNCLTSPIRGLINVLQAQIKQLEGE